MVLFVRCVFTKVIIGGRYQLFAVASLGSLGQFYHIAEQQRKISVLFQQSGGIVLQRAHLEAERPYNQA